MPELWEDRSGGFLKGLLIRHLRGIERSLKECQETCFAIVQRTCARNWRIKFGSENIALNFWKQRARELAASQCLV